MCANCVWQVFEGSVKAGGTSALPALAAAGAAATGMKGLAQRLLRLEARWLTPRR